MDEMLALSIISGVVSCLILYLVFNQIGAFDLTAEEMHERLDVMEGSLKIVASVLNELPNLVPKFELHNSPLSQILEFFQNLQSATGEAESYEGAALRDPAGMFRDGNEGTESSRSETPPE